MRHQHIVEHENIALLPGEADRLSSIGLAYLFEDRMFYRPAVSVVGISR